METGESGANGALALKHANKGSNLEHVNVIHQLHSTVEKLVWENERRLESAMTMFLVQVSCVLISAYLINHCLAVLCKFLGDF